MIRSGPVSETVKPCDKNTSEPGPARHALSPQSPELAVQDEECLVGRGQQAVSLGL